MTRHARVRRRPDLVAELLAAHEPHGLTQLAAVLPGHRPQGRHDPLGVGQVQLARAAVVAVDALGGDQALDVVEGLVDVVVHASAHRPVHPLQGGRPRLELGDHHAAVAAARTPPHRVGVEHDDRPAGAGQLPGA
jgi:hypothetical protein